jgi:hypothetical protein
VQVPTPRSYGWLGEHQDEEAAELAALLHEAAPKLALASLRGGQSPLARPLPKARSYEVSETVKDRLRAAAPAPTAAGQVDWSRLCACISSELLQFEDATTAVVRAQQLQAYQLQQQLSAAAAAAAAAAQQVSPRSVPASPTVGGGELLEINSGEPGAVPVS